MNKVFLIGNLTRDPELSTTSSGVSLCRLSLAVSRRFANADGTRETDFFNITVWRNDAENCSKYLNKGSKIAVVGSLQNRTYEVDGVKRYATDIVASEIEFLNSRSSGDSATRDDAEPVSDLRPVDDDSLPF
ncbi:MAG: single-stranded DNA-binding protein [Clostridia bacterium]|nr:single-stranded DNA-binding protein [Clostridia bacterium]